MSDERDKAELSDQSVPVAQGVVMAIRKRTSGPLQALYVLELARRFVWKDCQDSMTDEELQDLDVKVEELQQYVDACEEIAEVVGSGWDGNMGEA